MSADYPFAHAAAPVGGEANHVLSDNPERRFRLRCRYVETGRLAYLSHLEVAATLERVVRRARLPFAVSCGFSPHMKIAYGAALPVGIGSVCEIFDVTLADYVPADQAREALRAATVPDLMVEQCAYVEPRAKAASVAYPLSTYEVRLSRAVGELPVPEEVRIVRKRKERVLRVEDFLRGDFAAGPFMPEGPLELSEGVNGCGAAAGDAAAAKAAHAGACGGEAAPGAGCAGVGDATDAAGAVFHFTLEAKPTGSLRPDVLLRAWLTGADDVRVLSVTRVEQRA